MDKRITSELLLIGRKTNTADLTQCILAMSNMFDILDQAIARDMEYKFADKYVVRAEANLIWNMSYAILAADNIFIGRPWSYQYHIDNMEIALNDHLFLIDSYN